MDKKRLLELLQAISDKGPMNGPYFLPTDIKFSFEEMQALAPYLATDSFMGVLFATGLSEDGKAMLTELRLRGGES